MVVVVVLDLCFLVLGNLDLGAGMAGSEERGTREGGEGGAERGEAEGWVWLERGLRGTEPLARDEGVWLGVWDVGHGGPGSGSGWSAWAESAVGLT